MAKYMTNEEIKRELELLGDGEPYVERAVGTLPFREGIELLEQLDKEFRPYLIKYTALLNKTRKHIPVESAQLAPFKEMAEQLQECEVKDIAYHSTDYLQAIELMVNGKEHDIEDLIMSLYWNIQFTEFAKHDISYQQAVK